MERGKRAFWHQVKQQPIVYFYAVYLYIIWKPFLQDTQDCVHGLSSKFSTDRSKTDQMIGL